MTLPTLKDGAIADPTASQTNDLAVEANGGALSTGIGVGAREVYDPPALQGFVHDAVFVASRIGSITDNDAFTFIPVDVPIGGDLTYHLADIELEDGDQDVLTGNYNRTGKTIKVGQTAWLLDEAPPA